MQGNVEFINVKEIMQSSSFILVVLTSPSRISEAERELAALITDMEENTGSHLRPAVKLLRTENLWTENDVTEPKRKRSFPGNNAPLDRLSVNSMEARQGKKKQSKGLETPRRRQNPPPMDRVGTSRLPSTRG
uniref:Uncharacterized protein n=1 Tax=Fundulus heteroclitus TaxID=8078 RepID=A0A3Q2PZ01_FUNHE